jgi:hypothetical protein
MLLTTAILFSDFLYLNARYKFSNSFCCKFLNNLQKAIIDYRTEFKKSVYFLVEVATTLTIRTIQMFLYLRDLARQIEKEIACGKQKGGR